MKPIVARACLAAFLAAMPGLAWGQPATTDPTGAPARPTDPAATPPVVRLPSFPLNTPPAGIESTAAATNAVTTGNAEFGLQGGTVSVASPDPSVLRTNRIIESRGAIPKVLKPERRGVGGFLAGFANLFNPLAPVDQGTGGAAEYWYDGQLNVAPLPRSFQDERRHEPQIGLMKVPLERAGAKEARTTARP